MKKGTVYLVGAGPGDYRLISVKAQEYIEKADVIIYDRLADPRLLAKARPDAERIYVGKASSQHTMRQEEINQLLVDKAKEHKSILRLKGGDPFVFGRGGEEGLYLLANQVPFEVVPGISSAIAVPAYAGIPVTHRGIAVSFAVVTGHEDPGKADSGIRWEHLATGVDTLIFLMGVENIPKITEQLMRYGRSAETPAAVIRWGTKPEQTVLTTTVGAAADDVKTHAVKPPAIFIVGEVVRLREQLAWFDKRPLFGKRILVTRSREQASALSTRLEDLGAQCIEAPTIRIMPPPDYAPMDQAITALAQYQWVLFTSPNGVEAFYARLATAGKDSRAFGSVQVAAIGVATARALAAHGVTADIVPGEYRAEGLVEALLGRVKAGERVLVPRAMEAREVLPEELTALGAQVEVVPAYQTVTGDADGAEILSLLSAGDIDVVTFTSSSTVTNLLHLLGNEGAAQLAKATVSCIGPITAETCLAHGIQPKIVATEYTIRGLAEAIEQYFRGDKV